ncbi:MAG: hypothetical protein QOH89_2003, partial [Pseudonocardiales bacterium]|nr:hypothetical protein [Pseudonocardiales bacterium]
PGVRPAGSWSGKDGKPRPARDGDRARGAGGGRGSDRPSFGAPRQDRAPSPRGGTSSRDGGAGRDKPGYGDRPRSDRDAGAGRDKPGYGDRRGAAPAGRGSGDRAGGYRASGPGASADRGGPRRGGQGGASGRGGPPTGQAAREARPAPTDRELRRRAEKSLQVPEDIDPRDLDREVRGELRSLSKETADTVARHLVAAGRLIDDDPQAALAHAYAARAHAARIAAVREAVGIAAYLAGEWQVAIAELRAARRMSGTDAHLPLLADAERALGRPERALEIFRSPEARRVDLAGRMELLIVAAGARRDLGQDDAALVMLQVAELDSDRPEPWLARLRYAYADGLVTAGRDDEARDWFALAAEVDESGETDAAERVLVMDGFVLEDDFGVEYDYDEADGDDAGEESGEESGGARPEDASAEQATAVGDATGEAETIKQEGSHPGPEVETVEGVNREG